MIKVDIDGKTFEADHGDMIIEVADKAGIPIPRFCYHKKLSIAANCRMCLVEVEKAPKPLPACATPVADGMKIMTCSEKARAAQTAVMEFLLINHPLDCPICDQGGECELQDVSLVYGEDVSRYTQGKRAVKDKDIGPLIATGMTRCIHCTRCVRFGQEVAGIPEMGCTGRGENTEIGTYVAKALQSEVSGNMIDLCPVGALTSKPYRFRARAWEMKAAPSISPHDCIGTHIEVHQRRDEVMRVVPRECESINETWISDRDRFSYLGTKSHDRLTAPRIKQDGKWKTVDWLTALKTAVSGLGQVLERQGAEQVAGLIHPNSTMEELYLFQKWMHALKVNNVDHRCRQSETKVMSAAKPHFGSSIADIDNLNASLLVGSNFRKEQPLACLRLRKAQLAGATVSALNTLDYEFNFDLSHRVISAPQALLGKLAGIAKAAGASDSACQQVIDQADVDDTAKAIAAELANAERSSLILGAEVFNHPQASVLRALAAAIAAATTSHVNEFPEGGNVMGAHLAGALPDRGIGGEQASGKGLSTPEMFAAELAAYVLFNVEPEFDVANANQALSALDNARYVVQVTPYVTTAMEMYADVLLPIAPFTETSGTFVNIEEKWQSFSAAVPAQGQARPGWKVLRVLANLCQLPDFEYVSSEEIRDECRQAVGTVKSPAGAKPKLDFTWQNKPDDAFWRITTMPAYRSDAVVRRAEALQEVSGIERASVGFSTESASKLGIQDGDWIDVQQYNCETRLTAVIDDRIPAECVFIPAGFTQTNTGDAYGYLTVRTSK